MNQCLNERALLRVRLNEGTDRERSHLRLCADCAERYDTFAEDLDAMDAALSGVPPVVASRRILRPSWSWAPAVAMATLLLFAASVPMLRRPARHRSAEESAAVEALAADVSNALFVSADVSEFPAVDADMRHVGLAIDAGWDCARDGYVTGECSDQLSTLLYESED